MKLLYQLVSFSIFLLVCCASSLYAQNSGLGCYTGELIYTKYLGSAPHPQQKSKTVEYYSSTGRVLSINWNNSAKYKCGWVNSYAAGSYWDPTIPKYGANVPIPAQNEFTVIKTGGCVIAPYIGASLVADAASEAKYSINNPEYCSTQITPVPLDDCIWLVILGIASLGAIYLSKNKLAFGA
ncbi:MAG: hypothetical protein EOO87_12445 [Pedobacter sp.]|nr:MAG: hypothetical protein EOO87_12445 [Pedobacter sp.]